jgi:hypothetical protein
MNRRSLAAAVLAVVVPLAVVWLNGATGQEPLRSPYRAGQKLNRPADAAPQELLGWAVEANSNPRQQADHERGQQTRKLLSEYTETQDEKERAKVLDELTKVVSEHFDIRQEIREQELKNLEEQVKKLRELHQRRAKEKDQIIRDRVRQLLRDVDGLGWGDDGRPTFPVPVNQSLFSTPAGRP